MRTAVQEFERADLKGLQVSTPKVEMYSKFACPYCVRAKMLLKRKGVDFEEYDITLGGPKRTEMLERAPGARTVPQIFIGDVHVGGSDDLAALDRAGKLDALLGL
jgi:glutaredoxin 3